MAADTPETRARRRIDTLLEQAGWNSSEIAIEEVAGSGRLDYRLADLCILEAKRTTDGNREYALKMHLQQAQRYARTGVATPYLMVSDGELHFLQDTDSGRIERLYYLPSRAELETLRSNPRALVDGYIRDDSRVLEYQDLALQQLTRAFTERRPRALIEMATGTGKTRLAAEFLVSANRIVQEREGRRLSALFLVDRDTLEQQAVESLQRDVRSLKVATIDRLNSSRVDVLVAQVATLQNRYRQSPFHPTYFDLILVDEAHRSVHGVAWRQVVEYFQCPQVGLTATPPRLGDDETVAYFGTPIFEYGYEEAVREGVLAPCVIHRIKTNIDKDGLAYGGKLFESQDFGVAVEIQNRDRLIAQYYEEHFYGRKCLLFAASTRHAVSLWECFNELFSAHQDSFRAELVLSTTDSSEARLEHISEFQDTDSELKVLINLNILTAGFDFPSLDLLFMCRYTRHKSLYLQMKGRGARIPRDRTGRPLTKLDGMPLKDRFVMADFVGVTEWENKDPVIGVPGAAVEEFDLEAVDFIDKPPSLRDMQEILVADVSVEIAEVEIVSPFGEMEEAGVVALRAELAELKSELSVQRTTTVRERTEINRLKKALDDAYHEANRLKREAFSNLILALHSFSPHSRIDADLIASVNPNLPSLLELNEAFESAAGNVQEHVDRVLAVAARERYRTLVDRRHLGGITTAEEAELARLDSELDRLDEAFYQPVIEDLTAKLRRARGH